MPHKEPPVKNRFPVNRPHAPNKGNKGPHLTTILKKILSAKWDFKDPKIKALIKERKLKPTIETALMLRRILNGTEGDDMAIERILDRIDGKVTQKVESEVKVTQMGQVTKDDVPLKFDVGSNNRTN